MELTAKTLQEVTFGAKVRGYDPAEVDDFIAAVAEGVEELQERLRRATERAVRAEQAGGASPAAAPAPATSGEGVGNISKVLQAAIDAAENAAAEAKAEAQHILDEAQQRADQLTNDARGQSESQINDARSEAETIMNNARSEAARIADESQSQLRSEIAQLEQARDQLQGDVNNLSGYLDGEVAKVRETLTNALHALDANAGGASPAPVTSPVEVPAQEAPSWQGEGDAAAASEQNDPWAPVESTDQPQQSWEQPAEQDDPWAEPQNAQPSDHREGDQGDQQDADPFLAELRRAVNDDGPLGPRDEDDSSINSLYASEDEDDDKSGFFRRKK